MGRRGSEQQWATAHDFAHWASGLFNICILKNVSGFTKETLFYIEYEVLV